MKSIIQQIAAENRENENREAQAIQAEIENPATGNNRRNFLKKAAFGGIALGGLMHLSIEDTIAQNYCQCFQSFIPFRSEDHRYALCSYFSPGRHSHYSN